MPSSRYLVREGFEKKLDIQWDGGGTESSGKPQEPFNNEKYPKVIVR